jgi:hypothetical protein
VLSDTEQPRMRGRRTGPVARTRDKRGRKHLGGQIRGHLNIGGSAKEVSQDHALVAPVERRERVRTAGRRRQQLIVVFVLPRRHLAH